MMTTATDELTIEREADLRAQKRKILQRLKTSSAKFQESKDNVASVDGFLFEQEHSSDVHGKEKELASRESVSESFTNKLGSSYDDKGKTDEFSCREIREEVGKNKSPASPRRSRTFVKNGKADTPSGLDISIVIENTEPENYVPSFASSSAGSSACLSEYNRKTSEIRKKAEERRKNIVSPRSRSSNALGLPRENLNDEDSLRVTNTPVRSSSLTDLSRTTRTDEFESQEDGFRSKSQMSGRSEPLLNSQTRAYSSSSLSEFSSSVEELDLKDFARRQQEKLEDNLRRVEKNLDNTFSEIRKYINTGQTLTKKSLEEG